MLTEPVRDSAQKSFDVIIQHGSMHENRGMNIRGSRLQLSRRSQVGRYKHLLSLNNIGIMGSYNRITIVLFLLICLVSVGRGDQGCRSRGDGVVTTCRPTTSSKSSNTSTQLEDTENVTEIVTTMINIDEATLTQQTLTKSTSAPESTNGTTQNVIGTTVSREAKLAALGVTTAHSSVTEDTGNGTGVDVSTVGEGFTTREVDTTSTPTPSTPTPSTSTLSTPLGESEVITEIGTAITTEKSSRTTPTHQTLTSSRSAPDSTDGTTQNVIGTTVSREAKPTALGVTTVDSSVTEDIGIGTGVDVSTGGEGFTTGEVDVDVTSDGVDTTAGPLSGDLSKEGTTVGSEEPTNRLTVITTDNIIPTTDEWPTVLQDGDVLPSTSEYTDTTNTPIQEITGKVTTADSEMLTSALTTALGEQSTTHFASTPETLTTSDRSTTATLTTSEGQTTSWLPPETAEKATTAPLQTSSLITSERSTTSVLHTSLPPTTPERTTTAQQPTTSSQASTASPSTTHVAQTTAHDESQEPQEDDSMNEISLTDLTEEERENSLTFFFNSITVKEWMEHYDLIFRQFLSSSLTTNKKLVEPADILYIRPTPSLHSNILHVSILPTYSSMKRSALPFVPLNETLGALNLTALKDALGIQEEPTIMEGVPDVLLSTTQLPTALPTTDLPITQPSKQTEPPIIQPSTTEPPITQPTPPITQPSTTRKSPRDIGFLSNPGLFISLVVIATVSIIIIIVGLIYLLCDRRRGRTGEYITNHTPRNSDLELGLDNPVMAENDKNVSNGNHLSSIKGDMESDMIVPYDNFTQEELMNYEVEDTHL